MRDFRSGHESFLNFAMWLIIKLQPSPRHRINTSRMDPDLYGGPSQRFDSASKPPVHDVWVEQPAMIGRSPKL